MMDLRLVRYFTDDSPGRWQGGGFFPVVVLFSSFLGLSGVSQYQRRRIFLVSFCKTEAYSYQGKGKGKRSALVMSWIMVDSFSYFMDCEEKSFNDDYEITKQ